MLDHNDMRLLLCAMFKGEPYPVDRFPILRLRRLFSKHLIVPLDGKRPSLRSSASGKLPAAPPDASEECKPLTLSDSGRNVIIARFSAWSGCVECAVTRHMTTVRHLPRG
jgi:hypothetical protein